MPHRDYIFRGNGDPLTCLEPSKKQQQESVILRVRLAENAFIGKNEQPTDTGLTVALGPAKAVWDRLLAELAGEHGLDIREWKCHSPEWGYKRGTIYFSPR